MMLLVDASALVAIFVEEADGRELATRLRADSDRRTTPLATWEAAVAISRVTGRSPSESNVDLDRFLLRFDVRVVDVPAGVRTLAIEAHERFGKGRHPARLNFGDCFAYACAKLWDAKLLYKGDDFALTDVRSA